VLSGGDLEPITDHQEWLWRAVLTGIGNRDRDRHIGFGQLSRQSGGPAFRRLRRKYDRPDAAMSCSF
jgi:hypothetical protein